jgi:hypothetical protein
MAAEGKRETALPVLKKPEKLPHVYLVNKVKFHSVVSDVNLNLEIPADNMEEKMHQIIQHKIG